MEEINLCRLCLANSQTTQILNSDERVELLLQKHNVRFEKQDIQHICELCWTKVSDFDEFFTKVENIHNLYMTNSLKRNDDAVDEKIDIIEPVCIINPGDADVIDVPNIQDDNPIKMEPVAAVVDNARSAVASTRRPRKYYTESEDSDTSSDSIPLKRKRKNTKKIKAKSSEQNQKRVKKDTQLTEKNEEDENMTLVLKYVKLKCDLCRGEKLFTSFLDCKNHYRVVHKQNGYVSCCNRKFRRIGRIVQHCIWHENPEAFKCPTCEKCFQDSIRLRDHVTSMHVPNDEKRFQCELCSRLFAKQHLLNTHLKIKHTEKEDRPYACTEPDCDQRFVMPALLRFHIDKVHNLGDSRVCDICARFFKCSKSYERHYQVEHTNIDQRVQCDLCQKWFKHLDTLKEHIRRHKADRAQCKYCGRVSSNKKSLRLHVRNVHADIDSSVKSRNEYPCTVCGKIFKKKQTLREHVTLHTGEAFLYSCTFCPKTFRSSANMYAHRKRNHPKEYEEKCVLAKFHAGKNENESQSAVSLSFNSQSIISESQSYPSTVTTSIGQE